MKFITLATALVLASSTAAAAWNVGHVLLPSSNLKVSKCSGTSQPHPLSGVKLSESMRDTPRSLFMHPSTWDTLMDRTMIPSPRLLRKYQRRMDRNWDHILDRSGVVSSPRYQITDSDEKFQIAVDLPGVKQDDVDISLDEEGNVLSINGRRESSNEHYQFTSKFSKSFSLDPSVDVDRITATLENGVLIVAAPKDMKLVEEKVRKIPVTTPKMTETGAATTAAGSDASVTMSSEEKSEEEEKNELGTSS